LAVNEEFDDRTVPILQTYLLGAILRRKVPPEEPMAGSMQAREWD
jgi:hypothetical protein